MINNNILSNVFTENISEKKRQVLLEMFPELNNYNADSFLFLYKYYTEIPEKFYDQDIYNMYLHTLKDFSNNNIQYAEIFLKYKKEIDIAFSTIAEINSLDFHDKLLSSNQAEKQSFCDQTYNPSYLQLIEGVFSLLVKILATISRLNRKASIERLDLYNCAEELKDSTSKIFFKSYHHTVRNGIAHGGIKYTDRSITYTDKKNNSETLEYEELVDAYNDMIDCCNAGILALQFFLIEHKTSIFMPDNMKLEILRAETETPWWNINKSLDDEYRKQLNLFIKVNTIDYKKVYISSLQTGILVSQLFPNYDYYFLSLNSKVADSGFAMFDGLLLKEANNKTNKDISDYAKALQDDMVFYATKNSYPNFLKKIETYWYSWKIHRPLAIQEFHDKIGYVDVAVRHIAIHRRNFYLVIEGRVVINNLKEMNQKDIQYYIKKNIKQIVKATKKNKHYYLLPLGYIKISIYQQNYRVTNLLKTGLGSNLIGTVERNWFSKINTIDIIGSTVEEYKKYRFAWNHSWLNEHKTN